MSIERRRRNRIGFSVEARLNIGSKWYSCSCRNISMGGMLINSQQSFKKNANGLVLIEQKSGIDTLVIRASFIVTRDSIKDENGSEYESGLRFVEFFDESSLNLYRIVRHYDAI